MCLVPIGVRVPKRMGRPCFGALHRQGAVRVVFYKRANQQSSFVIKVPQGTLNINENVARNKTRIFQAKQKIHEKNVCGKIDLYMDNTDPGAPNQECDQGDRGLG